MGSLGHRALLQYIDNNDISGLRAILDSRHLTIDDRDEVRFLNTGNNRFLSYTKQNILWEHHILNIAIILFCFGLKLVLTIWNFSNILQNATTVLMVVAGRGLTAFVREFLARGADVQAEDLDNWTALLCASRNGHFDVVQLLLDHGAEVEHRDMVSPILKVHFLDQANLDTFSQGGWTSLMWAAYRGHTELVRSCWTKEPTAMPMVTTIWAPYCGRQGVATRTSWSFLCNAALK